MYSNYDPDYGILPDNSEKASAVYKTIIPHITKARNKDGPEY